MCVERQRLKAVYVFQNCNEHSVPLWLSRRVVVSIVTGTRQAFLPQRNERNARREHEKFVRIARFLHTIVITDSGIPLRVFSQRSISQRETDTLPEAGTIVQICLSI